jgi:NADH-quinone oxidoreductase subunit C
MEIAKRLQAQFPDEVLDAYEHQGQAAVIVSGEKIVEMLRWLRDDAELDFKHLMSLCAVDNIKRMEDGLLRFEVVYNLYSINKKHSIRIRAQVPEADHSIDTVTTLWTGADWLERECYDLMGITFIGHPDMRRILLPDDWEGHPLRKEYPLKGKEEWIGLTRLIEKVEELRQYSFGYKKPEESTKSSEGSELTDKQGND